MKRMRVAIILSVLVLSGTACGTVENDDVKESENSISEESSFDTEESGVDVSEPEDMGLDEMKYGEGETPIGVDGIFSDDVDTRNVEMYTSIEKYSAVIESLDGFTSEEKEALIQYRIKEIELLDALDKEFEKLPENERADAMEDESTSLGKAFLELEDFQKEWEERYPMLQKKLYEALYD